MCIQTINRKSDTTLDLRAAWESELQGQFGVDLVIDGEFLDWLWEEIARDHASEEIQRGDGEVLEHMVATAELPCVTRVQFSRGTSAGGGNSAPNNAGGGDDLGSQIKFDPKTKTHVKALSEYLSKIAAIERRVMEFRRRHLGGPKATVVPAKVPGLLEAWSIDPGTESEDDVTLYWFGEERPMGFRGGYWSAIGTLDGLCDYLAKKYPWNKHHALYFVLCGSLGQVKTVSGKKRNSKGLGPDAHKFDRYTITLEVEAWMPPELVKKAYAKLQRENKGGELTGEATTTRRSYGRTAEVFRFVVDRSEIEVVSEKENLGKLVLSGSWEELRKSWDKHLPANHAWRYGENGRRNFHRDFMRGQKAVTGTQDGLPGVPGQPVTQLEVRAAVEARDKRIVKSLRATQEREKAQSLSNPDSDETVTHTNISEH